MAANANKETHYDVLIIGEVDRLRDAVHIHPTLSDTVQGTVSSLD